MKYPLGLNKFWLPLKLQICSSWIVLLSYVEYFFWRTTTECFFHLAWAALRYWTLEALRNLLSTTRYLEIRRGPSDNNPLASMGNMRSQSSTSKQFRQKLENGSNKNYVFPLTTQILHTPAYCEFMVSSTNLCTIWWNEGNTKHIKYMIIFKLLMNCPRKPWKHLFTEMFCIFFCLHIKTLFRTQRSAATLLPSPSHPVCI